MGKIVKNHTNGNGKAAPKAAPAPVSTAPDTIFWEKQKNGKYNFDTHKLFEVLFPADGVKMLSINNKNILCKVNDKVVERIGLPELRSIARKYINDNEASMQFAKNINTYISAERLDYWFEAEAAEFLRDTETEARFVFRNCFVKVTKEGIEVVNHSELPAYVWRKNIGSDCCRKAC